MSNPCIGRAAGARTFALTLVLLALAPLLTGCASTPKVEVPKVVKEVVVTYAPIPASLTEVCVVPPKRDNTVGEALRIARDRRTCNEKDAADKLGIRKISNKAVKL